MGIKYRVNEDFFRKWSSEMAYVLGYLYADGSLEDASYLRGKYVRVTSVDRSAVTAIKKYLDSAHKIVKLKRDARFNRKDRYLLRIGSHKLYDGLVELGLHPKKSLDVRMPKVPNKYIADFIGGYFDGDGCAYLDTARGSRGQQIIKKLTTVFTSGSYKFLEDLARILKDRFGMTDRRVYGSRRAYQLRYSTKDSKTLFEVMYSGGGKRYFMRRKFNVFKEYFILRPEAINDTIRKILITAQ